MVVGAGALALTTMASIALSVTPAHAASPYWQPTSQVNRGSCTGTFQIQAGLYGQACTRVYSRSVDSVTFKNYLVVSNTGTSAQRIKVANSYEHGYVYHYNGGKWELKSSKDIYTGSCYETTIYSKQSLTCESSPATFVGTKLTANLVSGYGKISLVVSGQNRGPYYSVSVDGYSVS